MESLEESVLQQQRQRFEEMQAYMRSQHALQMAALNDSRDRDRERDRDGQQHRGGATGAFILLHLYKKYVFRI
jgi:hypothetical protein